LSVFIDAAARMVCMVPRARFVIVGDNSLGGTNEEYIHTLKGLIEDYGLTDRVKFAGFHSDMEEVYTGLDVLVNPTEWEAFGLVVVEGMACGKVVVASRAGGIPEIITDGRDGFLFPPHNSEKLASILCELISKPELRHNIGLMARQTAIDRFSVHRLTRTIGSIYLDLVEGRCAQQETGCSDQNNRLHVSDNRPKILLLDTSDMVGGVEMAHIMLARTIDRARFDLHVVCLDHGPVLQLFKTLPNLTLIPIAAGTRPAHLRSGWRGCVASVFSLIPLVVSAAQIICYSRRAGIRVVHTADKHRSILFALLLRFLNRIPFIFHIHNGYENSLIKQTALAQASMVIANSKASRQSCIDHLGASMERIRVVYNGIDTDRFKPGLTSNFRVELGAAPGDVIIGITNRLAPNKGQEVFIRAAAIVARAESHARFVIIGEDGVGGASSYACMLRNLVMELGLVDRLIFLGFRSDMEAIFTGLDVLVNPTEWEAFGLVVAEAMACGKVVAGARTGGIPELITHGSNGFLFEPHDEQTLAGILQEIVRKPELRETIGRAARQSIVDCFTIQRLARDVENVYSEVAANKYSQKL